MKLHCDRCGKELGTYLFGPGGIKERASIGPIRQVGLLDIVCFDCLFPNTPRLTDPFNN